MSTTGWIVLICLASTLVLLNITLFMAIRRTNRPISPDDNRAVEKARQVLKRPWGEEDDALQELNQLVSTLEKPKNPPSPPSPPTE